jgi:hypothetical protein
MQERFTPLLRLLGDVKNALEQITQYYDSEQKELSVKNRREKIRMCLEAAGVIAAIALAILTYRTLKTLGTQTRQSLESFRTDERAWIEIDTVKLRSVVPATQTPKVAESFVYEVFLKNVGKTVARDIVLRTVSTLDGNQGEINARDIQQLQDSLLTNQPPEPSPVPSLPVPKSLAPNTLVQLPFTTGGAAPQYGYMFSYSVGRIDYNDAFGMAHWLKFCFVVRDASGQLGYCETGNDEDENPELPPEGTPKK